MEFRLRSYSLFLDRRQTHTEKERVSEVSSYVTKNYIQSIYMEHNVDRFHTAFSLARKSLSVRSGAL